METIGQRIAQQRLTKRWTQERLASELGITQSVLSDIENDKVSPKWETIVSTAEKLEVPVSSLLPNSESNILYQPSMNDNSIGFVNHYNSLIDERKLWEVLLHAKDELISNQRLLIEMLQSQIKK
ncbi:helix-turn-helix domain-containing protein [Parafilimonas sp.]|uniref:helix-turn-helix domain-containing protein n=1 Tax=Parafilimonas sp. TaxID=1969739 RepID=UPI0039E71674